MRLILPPSSQKSTKCCTCEKEESAGISHNEAENARPSDLAAGTRVLAATLAELANR
jgi:acetylornithine deacetylase/succinyl-diaminopimelate desuccinylase-like protein